MKTATNIYIFNLALADSLYLATLPFQVGIYNILYMCEKNFNNLFIFLYFYINSDLN